MLERGGCVSFERCGRLIYDAGEPRGQGFDHLSERMVIHTRGETVCQYCSGRDIRQGFRLTAPSAHIHQVWEQVARPQALTCWSLPSRIQGGKAENASSVLCTAGRCKAAEHRSSGLKKCSVVRSFHQRPSTGMVDFAYLARSAFQILLFVYDLFYGVVCPSLRPQLLIVQKDHRRCFLQQWRCQWWHG